MLFFWDVLEIIQGVNWKHLRLIYLSYSRLLQTLGVVTRQQTAFVRWQELDGPPMTPEKILGGKAVAVHGEKEQKIAKNHL